MAEISENVQSVLEVMKEAAGEPVAAFVALRVRKGAVTAAGANTTREGAMGLCAKLAGVPLDWTSVQFGRSWYAHHPTDDETTFQVEKV